MIYLFSPFIPKEAGEEVRKVIDSGFINRGKQAEIFEKNLREKFGFKFIHTVNSCTSALKLALLAAKVRQGDEVISTPWTMVATNTSILEIGARPIFVDIDWRTLNIDPSKIEEKITVDTKAIMIVHYGGLPCNLTEIYNIAKERNLEVIEDCAHALGARYRGRYIGSFSKYACFSFQAIKTITTGDGGALATTKQEIYDEVVARSWFGIDKRKRINTVLGKYPEDIKILGFKMNINDISATLGIVGLRHFNKAYLRRKEIAKIYTEELEGIERIEIVNNPLNRGHAHWLFPILVKRREHLASFLRNSGIEVSKHNDRNDKYSIFGGIRKELENTEKVDKTILHLPIHPSLTDEELEFIIKKIKEWSNS